MVPTIANRPARSCDRASFSAPRAARPISLVCTESPRGPDRSRLEVQEGADAKVLGHLPRVADLRGGVRQHERRRSEHPGRFRERGRDRCGGVGPHRSCDRVRGGVDGRQLFIERRGRSPLEPRRRMLDRPTRWLSFQRDVAHRSIRLERSHCPGYVPGGPGYARERRRGHGRLRGTRRRFRHHARAPGRARVRSSSPPSTPQRSRAPST